MLALAILAVLALVIIAVGVGVYVHYGSFTAAFLAFRRMFAGGSRAPPPPSPPSPPSPNSCYEWAEWDPSSTGATSWPIGRTTGSAGGSVPAVAWIDGAWVRGIGTALNMGGKYIFAFMGYDGVSHDLSVGAQNVPYVYALRAKSPTCPGVLMSPSDAIAAGHPIAYMAGPDGSDLCFISDQKWGGTVFADFASGACAKPAKLKGIDADTLNLVVDIPAP